MAKRTRRWEGSCPWKRVVLKLSGEALADVDGENISGEVLRNLATEISAVRQSHNVDIAIVVGGGNIWRGVAGSHGGIDRAQSDHMGMLATVINAIALQDALERADVPTRVMTAIGMAQIAEPYIRRRAVRHLEKGRVVIFAAGTGNPFFTTDTAAALRAAEIDADAVLKGTHSGVDGVYTSDPKEHPDAELLEEVSFLNVLSQELAVMDSAAIAVCKDNSTPIVVFDLMTRGNFESILDGAAIGTLVK
ncbi:MAG TPA: UMP kinase [Acidimicrobiaceae bacterium]|nr:UMP kinase [Acidimicrobiaceae bacterium]MCH2634176.1 UMP kinase [Acidimicrobiales bacterium]HAY64716.1 UMP kinase [Acidimicrobiaceae bacterium]HCK75432.1 UMP kinase [Acidimicrobiaceae bacterium]